MVEDKYQKWNMEYLIDSVVDQLHKPESEARFTLLDMRYAYDQKLIDKNLVAQCSFLFIRGKMTGSYRSFTGFYGVNTIPTEIRRIMDKLLEGLSNT